jgi:hypothetical protein
MSPLDPVSAFTWPGGDQPQPGLRQQARALSQELVLIDWT